MRQKALRDARAWAKGHGDPPVYYGHKFTRGQNTGERAIVVAVPKKIGKNQITEEERCPESFAGVPTDIREVAEYKALNADQEYQELPMGGDSLGHEDITAGTLGGSVRQAGSSRGVALTNAHVAYPHWAGANIGDRVTQPGPHDIEEVGGDPMNHFYDYGVVHEGVTINMEGFDLGKGDKNQALAKWWWAAVKSIGNFGAKTVDCPYRVHVSPARIEQPSTNLVDAALVQPVQRDLLEGIRNIEGPIVGILDPVLDMAVIKDGRTTGVTHGVVTGLEFEGRINYGGTNFARFGHQGVVEGIDGEFSAGGDSGSMVFTELDGDLYFVGLLFAGGGGQTIINRASDVVRLLNLEI